MGDDWDHYDTIEWITQQPWCDGNVGMVGLSAFAAEQWRAAAQGHPALKAIFPFDAGGCYGGLEGFRDQHPGGVIQTMPYHIGLFNSCTWPSVRRRSCRPRSKPRGRWPCRTPTT